MDRRAHFFLRAAAVAVLVVEAVLPRGASKTQTSTSDVVVVTGGAGTDIPAASVVATR